MFNTQDDYTANIKILCIKESQCILKYLREKVAVLTELVTRNTACVVPLTCQSELCPSLGAVHGGHDSTHGYTSRPSSLS